MDSYVQNLDLVTDEYLQPEEPGSIEHDLAFSRSAWNKLFKTIVH